MDEYTKIDGRIF